MRECLHYAAACSTAVEASRRSWLIGTRHLGHSGVCALHCRRQCAQKWWKHEPVAVMCMLVRHIAHSKAVRGDEGVGAGAASGDAVTSATTPSEASTLRFKAAIQVDGAAEEAGLFGSCEARTKGKPYRGCKL